jgi:ABC-type amino acid transport system permease subunit
MCRGGIESMPVGQYEAAKVLGYGKTQTFVKIILPQVIKRILPSVTNEVITLVKDTSLAFSIAYAEMFSQAKALAASQKSMIPFSPKSFFTCCISSKFISFPLCLNFTTIVSLMIITHLFLKKFHDKCHHIVKDIIEYRGCHKRDHALL